MSCDREECCVCWEELQTRNVCITKCGHSFCLSCMLNCMNYNNTCPYCRTELKESKTEPKSLTEDDDSVFDEEEEDEEDNNSEFRQQLLEEGWIDDDDCYHYPVVIENMLSLTNVISEANGITDTLHLSKGWILKMISVMNQNENSVSFDFNDDKTLDEDDEYLSDPTTIIEPVNIYKRTIMLKKHLKHKYNLM